MSGITNEKNNEKIEEAWDVVPDDPPAAVIPRQPLLLKKSSVRDLLNTH